MANGALMCNQQPKEQCLYTTFYLIWIFFYIFACRAFWSTYFLGPRSNFLRRSYIIFSIGNWVICRIWAPFTRPRYPYRIPNYISHTVVVCTLGIHFFDWESGFIRPCVYFVNELTSSCYFLRCFFLSPHCELYCVYSCDRKWAHSVWAAHFYNSALYQFRNDAWNTG